MWFREADANRDGYLDGTEAVSFFTRTGLPTEELSKVCRGCVHWVTEMSNGGRSVFADVDVQCSLWRAFHEQNAVLQRFEDRRRASGRC